MNARCRLFVASISHNHARAALSNLEHLVVQDIFPTETAAFADVILPASAWPEKDGTVTNTDRKVQLGRKAVPMPGEAKQDWWIIKEIGLKMGLNWNYESAKEIFNEMKKDLKNISIEIEISDLESQFSKDLNENTFNEIRELKKLQNLN